MGVPEHYPKKPRAILEALLEGLGALGDGLVAVVVYGSLARGDYRAEHSDINVAVVLQAADRSTLGQLRPVLRQAWLTSRVAAFVLTQDEITRVTDAFPIKLADIQRSHDLPSTRTPTITTSIPSRSSTPYRSTASPTCTSPAAPIAAASTTTLTRTPSPPSPSPSSPSS